MAVFALAGLLYFFSQYLYGMIDSESNEFINNNIGRISAQEAKSIVEQYESKHGGEKGVMDMFNSLVLFNNKSMTIKDNYIYFDEKKKVYIGDIFAQPISYRTMPGHIFSKVAKRLGFKVSRKKFSSEKEKIGRAHV